MINFFLVINAQTEPELHSFSGIITTFTDSGLGPYYSFDVENPETKESISTLLYIDYAMYLNKEFGEEANVLGKKVNLKYSYNIEYFAERINKGNELIIETGDENIFSVVGTYSGCEIGDMGGYLDVELPGGERMDFMTAFECPEDIKEGEPIVVYYYINKLVEVTELKAVK